MTDISFRDLIEATVEALAATVFTATVVLAVVGLVVVMQ